MSGQVIPTVLGKGQRFPGFGPLPIPWYFNSALKTEAEDIKKWQEYTEEIYKTDLNHPDNHEGVIIQLEPDILECKVKWALRSIPTNKASGSDGIPA